MKDGSCYCKRKKQDYQAAKQQQEKMSKFQSSSIGFSPNLQKAESRKFQFSRSLAHGQMQHDRYRHQQATSKQQRCNKCRYDGEVSRFLCVERPSPLLLLSHSWRANPRSDTKFFAYRMLERSGELEIGGAESICSIRFAVVCIGRAAEKCSATRWQRADISTQPSQRPSIFATRGARN